MSAALSQQQLLSVWEQGLHRHPIDRALLLYSVAKPEKPLETLAEAPLGMRNAALFELLEHCFNSTVVAWIDCSSCGERMTIELDRAQLPPPPSHPKNQIEIRGHLFHLINSRHLASMAKTVATETHQMAARQLLQNCAENVDELPDDDASFQTLQNEVEAAMDEADPWADLSLRLDCPGCAQHTVANFDIADYLWSEVDSFAHRLLDDIHKLAEAYGWSEYDILVLSKQRRHAYLDRLQT